AIARHRDHLPAWITDLRADGLRQSIGHGSVVKRTDNPSFAVHGEIPGGPDRWRSYIAGKDRILGCELVEHARYILRMDRFLAGTSCGHFVQTLARLAIVLQRFLQMRFIGVLLQLR